MLFSVVGGRLEGPGTVGDTFIADVGASTVGVGFKITDEGLGIVESFGTVVLGIRVFDGIIEGVALSCKTLDEDDMVGTNDAVDDNGGVAILVVVSTDSVDGVGANAALKVLSGNIVLFVIISDVATGMDESLWSFLLEVSTGNASLDVDVGDILDRR